jgi:serine/threonine protein kinase
MGITIGTNEYSIISEYMKNKSLWHNLHEIKQRFSAQEKINLIEAVAKGMTYLHERDICHYSLKSQNILMDEGWTAKISDFGLRNYKHFGEDPDSPAPHHSEKFMVGNNPSNTVHTDNEYWICPEIFNGEKYDTKSDVYSFGVLMW